MYPTGLITRAGPGKKKKGFEQNVLSLMRNYIPADAQGYYLSTFASRRPLCQRYHVLNIYSRRSRQKQMSLTTTNGTQTTSCLWKQFSQNDDLKVISYSFYKNGKKANFNLIKYPLGKK